MFVGVVRDGKQMSTWKLARRWAEWGLVDSEGTIKELSNWITVGDNMSFGGAGRLRIGISNWA